MNIFLSMVFQPDKRNWALWVWPDIGPCCSPAPTESLCFGDDDLIGASARSFSVWRREGIPWCRTGGVHGAGICFFKEERNAVLTQCYTMIILDVF